jgi:flap endonuclease-1
LYKFASEGSLLENFYLLISLFRHYNITPVFIFDGKPPIEKRQLLIQRRIEKREAEEKYAELQKKLELDGEVDDMLLKEMEYLKKQSTFITYDNIQNVKDLMNAYGINYICAEGEADALCVQIAKTNAWGCMSDDMDMFVYGCPRVFRALNITNHTLLYYDTESILKDLNLNLDAFREIAVLSGTDYSTMKTSSTSNIVSLHATYNYYTKYKKSGAPYPFYE